MSLPRAYEDSHEPGALGVVEPFAKAHKLKTPEAQQIIQSVLSYTLHKPRRTRFPTTPTLIFDQDERWQMDLVDMQKLRRWNKGHKCLLTVIDVLSKYAWAVPIRSKSSKEVIRGLAGIYKQASPRAATPRADGSRQRILQCRGSSVVEATGYASFFHVWG